jgi:hypothetical protein
MASVDLSHDTGISPHDHDENNVSLGNDAVRGTKRARNDDDDDDDEKGGKERRKIDIKFITDKSRRHITFSKRKAGIMKKVSAPLSWSSGRVKCELDKLLALLFSLFNTNNVLGI